MSQTAIDFSQSWATWIAGDGADLGRFDIVGGGNDPPPHQWGMLVNSMFAATYEKNRGTACSFWARAANSTGAVALVSVAEGQWVGRRGNVLGSFALQASDLTVTDRWEVIRDFDFGAVSNTDFAAGGDTTYALNDGNGAITWTAASTANANGGSSTNGGIFRKNSSDVGADGGSGLRIFHDPSINTNFSTGTTTGPRLSCPLSSLDPNYDETAEYRLEVLVNRWADSSAGTLPSSMRAAMVLRGETGAPTGAQVRQAGVGYDRAGANTASATVVTRGASVLPISDYQYAGGSPYNVLALQFGPSQVVLALAGQHSGAWPATTALRALGATSESFTNAAGSPINSRDCRVTLAAWVATSGTGSVDVMFRRLRLLKRVR